MTKTQLITALQSKYADVELDETKWVIFKIGTPSYIDHIAMGIPVLDTEGDSKTENLVAIWRKDSDYYWKMGEPKANGIVQRMNTFINSKITDGTVKFASIEKYNPDKKVATVYAIMADKTTKTALLKEGNVGEFTIEVL